MQDLVKYIFLFLVGTTLLNLIIAGAARIFTKDKHFNLLLVYWISLFATYFAAALLKNNEQQIAYAYFFQIAPSYLMVKMLTDSRGLKLPVKIYGPLWLACAAFSAILIQNGTSFTLSLVPVTFATTVIYFKATWNTLVTDDNVNWIEKAMAWMFVTGVINHWNYAFFRLEESTQWWGWSVSIAQYQCLSIFLPLLINHRRSENEKKNVQGALEKLGGTEPIVIQDNIDQLYRELESQINQKEILTNKLQKINESLKEEQETNEILIKTISHDLANPLTVVNAYSEMMLNNRIAVEDYKTTITKMKKSVNIALDMISRIRNAIVTRNQAGMVSLHNVSVDRAVQKLLESFDAALESKKIQVNYSNKIAPDRFVFAEENTLVTHVLSNVLSNAIKFSHQGSTIDINVEERADFIDIKIIDHGVGIDKKRLNERRFLLSTEGTQGEQGSGFGFMIMSYFLRKFGGNFHLHSDGKGQGSVATISLKKSINLNATQRSVLSMQL